MGLARIFLYVAAQTADRLSELLTWGTRDLLISSKTLRTMPKGNDKWGSPCYPAFAKATRANREPSPANR
eukprot:11517114-Heterocapsa_arctica.AAC.1